jgi:hypothetical protein
MYIQVTNNTKTEFNQIRSTKTTLIKDLREQGWEIKDCNFKEMPEALVETKYRGTDGKTGNKTYSRR